MYFLELEYAGRQASGTWGEVWQNYLQNPDLPELWDEFIEFISARWTGDPENIYVHLVNEEIHWDKILAARNSKLAKYEAIPIQEVIERNFVKNPYYPQIVVPKFNVTVKIDQYVLNHTFRLRYEPELPLHNLYDSFESSQEL